MKKSFYLFIFCLSILSFSLHAQSIWEGYEHLFNPVRNYVVYQTNSEIIIDGNDNEIAWDNAKWSGGFLDIEGEQKSKPLYETRIKMLWDTKNIYILAEMEEPHIWATYSEHDQIVYHENDIEVFIDPFGSTHAYYEIELNAKNTLFDLFMTKPYRDGGFPLISWNAPGFKSAVKIDGTLNDPSDIDEKWTVEMAIPFNALRKSVGDYLPKDGAIWKMGFSRVQWQTEIKDGKYRKLKDEKTKRNLQEYNWVWSPQGLINMHYPERWGMVQFSENQVDLGKIIFQVPEDEELKKYLWLVYYKQRKFLKEHGFYATSLDKIGIPENIEIKAGINASIEFEATKYQFLVSLKSSNNLLLTLNHEGRYRKRNLKSKNLK